jgi:DNA-binding protein
MAEKKAKEAKESKAAKAPKAPKAAKEVSEAGEAAPTQAPRAQPAPTGAQAPTDDHFVFVGKKGAMAYVFAVMTHFGEGAKTVIIKARGRSISSAVDVAEIVRNREPSIKLVSIGISTEEVTTEDGRPIKVSAIEIILSR